MSLRQYEVLGVRTVKSTVQGEPDSVHLDLKLVNPVSIRFKSPQHLLNVDSYIALVGNVVTIDTRQGEMNGEPWTSFRTDGIPTVQVSAENFLRGKGVSSPVPAPAPAPAPASALPPTSKPVDLASMGIGKA
jgi:hypothetical protein